MKIARRVLRAVLWFVLGVLLVRLGAPAQVTIQWETASEVAAAGFRLYRAASAKGPFTLLSETLIPAQGDPLTGASYEYEDRETSWGREYFYQLEEVDLNGAASLHPEMVQSRAGAGWPWAIASGVLLALLGEVMDRRFGGAVFSAGASAEEDVTEGRER